MLGVWSDMPTSPVCRSPANRGIDRIRSAAINTIAQPKFAELYARGEMNVGGYRTKAPDHDGCAAPVLIVSAAPDSLMFGSDFSGAIVLRQILSASSSMLPPIRRGAARDERQELEYRNQVALRPCAVAQRLVDPDLWRGWRGHCSCVGPHRAERAVWLLVWVSQASSRSFQSRRSALVWP
jgi:hypothetical protein